MSAQYQSMACVSWEYTATKLIFQMFANKKKTVMVTYVIKDNPAVCIYFRIYRRCKFPTFCSNIHPATVNVENIEEDNNNDEIRKSPKCIVISTEINAHLEEKLSDRKYR